MAYRRKTDVLNSIKTRTKSVNGVAYTVYEAYFGVSPLTRSPERRQAKSIEALRKIIADFYKQLSAGGESRVELTASQSIDARTALDLLAQAKSDLTLTDCVRRAVNGTSAPSRDTTIADAWERFFASIANRSEDYRKTMRSRVGAWIANTGGATMLSSVTAAGVKEYLMANVYHADRPETAKTYNNVLGDIHTFFRWCASKEQCLVPEDPLDGMKRMEIVYRQPEYVKAADAARLFAALEAHKDEAPADLADAILSFFCGMRQIEIERVREGESAVKISLEDHFIRVIKCTGSTRGIRPRTFHIPEQAEAWMRSFDFMSAVRVPNVSFREHLLARAKEAGMAHLPENAGRHTFITMYEAAHHDTNALSGIVGNTDAVRARSYNGVELSSEGEAYFRIMPKGEK